MVPDVAFSSYYGRPVVKPPPWDEKIAAYLFLGGVAGGSALLGAGAQLTGRPALRRNSRLAALTATGLGTLALVDRKSTRLNSSHVAISYAVFCLKKKKESQAHQHAC